MKQLILISFTFFLMNNVRSQEACEVKMKEISGTYSGDCKDGKANGSGKSKGTDEYQGEFKAGYPDGKGMYIYQDGHYFMGFFKKGKKEGRGDMYYENSKGDDSVISGYWKKDLYVGLYEKPWDVMNPSTRIGKVEGRKISKEGSTISFTVHQMSNASSMGNSGFLGGVVSESVMQGTFENRSQQNLSNSTITRYQQVRFPFKVLIMFTGNESAEFIFYEPGDYDLSVNLSQ